MKAMRTIQAGMILASFAAGSMLAGAQAAPTPPTGGPGFGMHRPPMERMLGPGGTQGRWWNNPNVIDQLKLTDDQRKSMDDILQSNRDNLIDMRANVEKAEGALEPLMSADQPNESAILAQIDRVAQARAELEKSNARFLLSLRAKLTPDQWKELQTMRSERHGPGGGSMRHPGWRNQTPPAGAPSATPPPDANPQSLMDDIPFPGQEEPTPPANR